MTGEVRGPRVSTIELFFDLVFVFTVTQLASVLVHHVDWAHTGQVALMLGLIWWMYAGYNWLTNAVAPSSTLRRTLLLTGMIGFLIISLAIPEAFDGNGWAFGVGYLIVTVVHSVLFLHADDNVSIVKAITNLAPLNGVTAVAVLVGGFMDGNARIFLWSAALLVIIIAPYLQRMGAWTIEAGHFAERHGLVVIVAIGESVVAIGLAFREAELDAGTLAVAILGLAIAYYLYWTYFSGDESRAEHALHAEQDPARKARLAVFAYGYAHVILLAGIVGTAVGVELSVAHALEPMHWSSAVCLSAGVAVFLLGHAWFLRLMRLPGGAYRLVAAAAVLAAIPLGHWLAVAQLAAVLLIMMAASITRDLRTVRVTRTTQIHDFGR
ncbi:low temperature requirement protein A [Dactylosporangium sp. NPDC051541]|uniref:low temperature requirement protein A n=1 Tax=Dactylosporangium sp. NPDC051541 TaxID=3363977 RepID=UPI0037B006DD